MRKNILFINHSIRDGGPGRSLYYLLKHFDYKNFNVNVLIPSKDTFSHKIEKADLDVDEIVRPNFPENLKKQNFSLFGKKISIFFIDLFINIIRLFIMLFQMRNIIKDKKIDLIYCNGTQAKIFGSIVGLLYRINIIWHVRNIQSNIFLKWLLNTCSKISFVKKIICVSNATRLQFTDKSKTVVINNGIDTNEYASSKVEGKLRNEFQIDKETIIIGTAGRVVPRKGFEYFIQLAGEISHKFKKDCVFVLVGDTPFYFNQKLMQKLKKSVDDLNISKKFIFTGYKSDVESYITDFDIFFIPSRYPDPFPRVVIESMSLGKPVIGFNIGGIGEAIDNNINGFSLDLDCKDVSAQIVRLIEDNELRMKMGYESRKKAVSKYDSRIIANKIINEINSLVSSSFKA